MTIPMTPTARWYSDGLRWIGTLFTDFADCLDKPSFAPAPGEPRPKYLPVEEYLFDVRSRMIQHL
jgi:hypothetical protein